MKSIPFHFPKLTSSFCATTGLGCLLAFIPLAASAQYSGLAKEKASQSQPSDPTESKTGELNQAKPGGPVKISAEDAQCVTMFSLGNVGEARLAELALKNSSDEKVEEFARMMIRDHSKANDELLCQRPSLACVGWLLRAFCSATCSKYSP